MSAARRIAAIDIGTNSALLTIAGCSPAGCTPLVERATITRLGRGVDRTGVLEPEAVERTLACLEDYAALLREHDVEQLQVVGTSALRDAANASDFVTPAEAILGTRPRVLSGAEEATFTFDGALSGLDLHGSVAVVDIGGGSTEFIVCDERSSSAPIGVSVDIGCVRLTERHLASDPPSEAELKALEDDVSAALTDTPTAEQARHLIAVAGTATTLAALELGLSRYDSTRVHGFRLGRDALDSWIRRLSAMTLAERRTLPALEPTRADIIVAGAVVLRAIVTRAHKDACIVSCRGVRWGLILRAARNAPPRRA